MTKIDTKEMKERYLLRDPNKTLSIGDSLEVAHLCDAYDEAQKRISELEEVTTNHCDLNQDRVLRLEALLKETVETLEYKRSVKVYNYIDENYETLEVCLFCGGDASGRYAHADLCLFTRIQKELGEG